MSVLLCCRRHSNSLLCLHCSVQFCANKTFHPLSALYSESVFNKLAMKTVKSLRYSTSTEREPLTIVDGKEFTAEQRWVHENFDRVRRVVNRRTKSRKLVGGRKPKTTEEEDALICKTIQKYPTESVKFIHLKYLPQFSYSLVQRRLRKFNLQTTIGVTRVLSNCSKNSRLKFAKEYVDRPSAFWRSIFFASEIVLQDEAVGVQENAFFGGIKSRKSLSLTLSGERSQHRKYWFALKYNEPIRWFEVQDEKNVDKFIRTVKSVFDGEFHGDAPKHIVLLQDDSNKIITMLNSDKLECIQVPPNSPDLNIIKNLSSVLNQQLNKLPGTKDLADRIERVLRTKIDAQYINNLVDSVPARLKAIIRTGGNCT
ncbi:hypothetical protein EG68_07261 [Paragonimus skrjabini miyazakii]|uniref:Transposase n=1 Tax=Paragonimus skrjabini miyazakii TaxID=59628 RepID=A0A8S9YPN3_9TREM|nr:hypothetical protein EG68_07261 [Paragonimus skrjabini miyazakii]